MHRKIDIDIDYELCTGCSSCLSVCPCETLSIVNKKVRVTGSRCIQCGHCVGACPSRAIVIGGHDSDYFRFNTFKADTSCACHGRNNTGDLVNLMASRRSCRSFFTKDVERGMLEDLVKIGTMAPSGTNSQKWTFTVVENRKSMICFGEAILAFYKKANKMAENRCLRLLLKIVGKKKLDSYYKRYYEFFKTLVEKWDNGEDKLFHGATAAIIVGAKPGGSCPMEDSLLATQNILLAAHTMGLGTCLIGFAEQAIKNEPAIKQRLGIPPDERIYSVIAMGHNNERYHSITGRKQITPRWFHV